MQFQYKVKVSPYEAKVGPFGKNQIITEEERTVELPFESLSAKDQEAVMELFGSNVPPLKIETFTLEQRTLTPLPFGIDASKCTYTAVKSALYVSDHELTGPEAVVLWQEQLLKQAEAVKRQNDEKAQAEDYVKAYRREWQAHNDRMQAAKEEQVRTERQALAVIPYDERGIAITNLYERIMAVSELEVDNRFKSWIRHLTGVNPKLKGAFMFEGHFVNNQTVEIRRGDATFLVASETGSRQYHNTTYVIVTLRHGVLGLSDIEVTDEDPGWALLIRDDVAEILRTEADWQDPFEALRDAVKAESDEVTVSRDALRQLLKTVS